MSWCRFRYTQHKHQHCDHRCIKHYECCIPVWLISRKCSMLPIKLQDSTIAYLCACPNNQWNFNLRSHGNARARPACLTGWEPVFQRRVFNRDALSQLVSLRKTGLQEEGIERRKKERERKTPELEVKRRACWRASEQLELRQLFCSRSLLAGLANITHRYRA